MSIKLEHRTYSKGDKTAILTVSEHFVFITVNEESKECTCEKEAHAKLRTLGYKKTNVVKEEAFDSTLGENAPVAPVPDKKYIIGSAEHTKRKAQEMSRKSGAVQHVNKEDDGKHHVSDFYDSNKTVASYHYGKLKEATDTHELGIDHDEPMSRRDHIKSVLTKHGATQSGSSDKSTYFKFDADKVEAAKKELKAGRVHADHWVNGELKENLNEARDPQRHIKVGSKVRSYDFPGLHDNHYVEGHVTKVNPSSYHIAVHKVVRDGKEIPTPEHMKTVEAPKGKGFFSDAHAVHHIKENLNEAQSPTAGTRLVKKYGSDEHRAEVRYNPDYQEYQVHHYKDGKHMGEGPVSYHGDDKQDAHDTAKSEADKRSAVKEDAQLDELSKSTMKSYLEKGIIKGMKDAREGKGDISKKREASLNKAITKVYTKEDFEDLINSIEESDAAWAEAKEKEKERNLTDKDKQSLAAIRALMAKEKKPVKEDTDQLDELKKSTLASYVQKAAKSATDAASEAGYKAGVKEPRYNVADDTPTEKKRFKGIAMAAKKLAEGRNQADKMWDAAEAHKAKADKSKKGSEEFHAHMANHHDALSIYHSDLGQNSESERHLKKAEIHHEKSLQASDKGLAEATVATKKYSCGTMKTVHQGADFSIPLHPEHHQAIAKLKDEQEHKFKDETGRHWTARRKGDEVHFQGANGGNSTTVKHSTMAEAIIDPEDKRNPDIPTYLRKQQGQKPLSYAEIKARSTKNVDAYRKRAGVSEDTDLKAASESVEDLIAQLSTITENTSSVKFNNGETADVTTEHANALINLHGMLSDENKQKLSEYAHHSVGNFAKVVDWALTKIK